ncbi:hepatitis A virus cellular receptor 2 isoform X1 [Erinaceus europaeus]|uniref:Hepatitis A virus cellular receptor 2 isoform X1 n=1 Tax=Erinaceus europaeus TaxID=9365 RepID=A0A1S3A3D3_ERIEU|nr:hepatitis A virus cellular receptor 2 isoform X1 [Erinaceus europaeus]
MFSYLFLDCVLLLLFLLSGSLGGDYIFKEGQNAYLPCKYSPPTPKDGVPVCWGRGPCPLLDCERLVLRTDGRNLSYRTSYRYQLKGRVHKGDVSLTIENVALEDSGTYCCRIQLPGLWNDNKINLKLVVKPAKLTPTLTLWKNIYATFPRTLPTTGLDAETQTLVTIHNENQTGGILPMLPGSEAISKTSIYVGAGVSAGLALALILGVFIFKWYSHIKESQNLSLITLANTPSSGIANAVAEGMRSEENIYIIEENVYEIEDPYEYYCSVPQGQLS